MLGISSTCLKSSAFRLSLDLAGNVPSAFDLDLTGSWHRMIVGASSFNYPPATHKNSWPALVVLAAYFHLIRFFEPLDFTA